MKRHTMLLLLILLIASHLMPWFTNTSDMSEESGLNRLIFHFVGGIVALSHGRLSGVVPLLIGIIMLIVLASAIKVLVENKRDNWNMRKSIFLLTIVSFLLPRITVLFEMGTDTQLIESLFSVFSIVLYGQYLALCSATGLLLLGKSSE